MKKILAILVTICLMASALIITTSAALLTELDATPLGAVLRISALKRGETNPVTIGEYSDFKDGWNKAMKIAGDDDVMDENGYDRIVVDLLTDWKANKDGQFSDDWIGGDGFKHDTIFIPAEARVTLNLNGYSIDRGLTDDEDDGEVMFINDDADVIINNGTITGGYSNSEGGGLYIEGAKVTLNNVNIIKNTVEDDDGAGIAAYGNTTLIINGGSISDNLARVDEIADDPYGGAICIEGGTAILTGVTIKGNAYKSSSYWLKGAAIYSYNASVTMTDCIVQENGLAEYDGVAHDSVNSIIYADESKVVIKNTNFIDNGRKSVIVTGGSKYKSNPIANTLITAIDSEFTLIGGEFTGNDMAFLFKLDDATTYVEGVDFTGNDALALVTNNDPSSPSLFANCKFGAGTSINSYYKYDFDFWDSESGIVFEDCTFDNSTFNDKNAATFYGGNVSNTVGSIFGEGSVAMTFSFIALIVACVSIFLVMQNNKKKNIPKTNE